MIGKNQIKILRLLGYENTKEDGAILQHNQFHNMGRFVWSDETFHDVISMYRSRLEYAVRREIVNMINYKK